MFNLVYRQFVYKICNANPGFDFVILCLGRVER